MNEPVTSPSNVCVAALDDNPDFLERGLVALNAPDFDTHRFTDPAQFLTFTRTAPTPLVCIVDHDLGLPTDGYEVVRQLRQARPDGLLLPIVYLTGRETPDNFVAAESADPYAAPSCFVNKRDLVHVDLDALVLRLVKQHESAVDTADAEAVSRALDLLGDLSWEV